MMETSDGTGAMAEMPRYKCHEEVWALKIKDRCYRFPGSDEVWTGQRLLTDPGPQARISEWGLEFEDDKYAPVWLGVGWMTTHNPQPGGYYVVYADGHKSYSPVKAFEEGYTRI